MEEEKFENMHNMKLGQHMAPDVSCVITRLPGGWAYSTIHGTCFVPYSTEFKEKEDF